MALIVILIWQKQLNCQNKINVNWNKLKDLLLVIGICDVTIVRPTDSVVSPVERFEAPSLEEDELGSSSIFKNR